MPEVIVSLRDLAVGYDAQPVVSDINFDVNAGEIISLLGVSGSGKSTILRSIAGFVTPSNGSIAIDGTLVCEGSKALIPPEKRRLGMMFQDYALFPYLTVAENVAFGIKGQADAPERVTHLMNLVGITELADRKPGTLSGGQQQRVALIRALAPKPRLLLLDEPFANLDGPLRREIGGEVRQLLKQEGMSAILVTHDRHEALGLSDRVGVLANSEYAGGAQLLQFDTPAAVYHAPVSADVARLTGPCFFMDAQDAEQQMVTPLGPVNYVGSASEKVEVAVRPHQLFFTEETDGPHAITDVTFIGPGHRYTVEGPTGPLWFDGHGTDLTPGTRGRLKVTGPVHGWPA